MNAEPYVPPKELAGKLASMGLTLFSMGKPETIAFRARSLVSSMKQAGHGAVFGNSVRASDAYSFLQINQNWRPWSGQKKKQKHEQPTA